MKSLLNPLMLLLFILFLVAPTISHGQGLPIDRFCEIYADSAPERLDKIIRIFKLERRPAEQLTGKATCQTGETFILNNSCVGPNRIAILSLSRPPSEGNSIGATRLFHLVSLKYGENVLTPCLPPTEE